MSCTYADGLSPYDDKGVLGVAERFDKDEEVNAKCEKLAQLIEASKHVVVHTGAGISTSAGIPDFRGPNGVWTLEKKGKKPKINISFNDAVPTKTHMALKALIEKGYVHYVISQNIDGLHLKSGLSRKYISELHGNMFVEQCNKCHKQYVRQTAATTVGQKPCGGLCKGAGNSRPCRGGTLLDNVLDWEHDLPEKDLDMSLMHSTLADLNITLGTTLQIVPSGNLPLKNKKYDGKLVICNLQPTKHDKKADFLISTYVDDILTKLCKRLGVEIPQYAKDKDPTQIAIGSQWTLPADVQRKTEKIYNQKIKEYNLKRKANNKDKIDVKKLAKLQKFEDDDIPKCEQVNTLKDEVKSPKGEISSSIEELNSSKDEEPADDNVKSLNGQRVDQLKDEEQIDCVESGNVESPSSKCKIETVESPKSSVTLLTDEKTNT